MPVNSLSITKRELRKFEGTAESGRVDITGEYEVTIKNEGVLPTFASQYEVQKLSPTSVNKTLITEKSGDIGRLSPGSSESVNISFKISGNKDQLMTLARTGCNGNTIQCKVKEQVVGTVFVLPFDKKRDLSVSAGSCSLDSGTGRAPVEPAPTPPEPTPPEPVQNLTMRIGGPTEVTAGQEDSWVIDGNNINEVNQIRVELGDGSTTTTRREIQAQNPRQPQTSSSPGLALSGAQKTSANNNASSSDARQVFTHTYSSEGQYTIVAEAINSNGETVGSARYGVTVNPQVTTDPVDPEPTKPANFDITVNSKNEPVNPGGQMVIDYTVENTGDASGTGNITLNVDGQRADSSRRTVNAGSSTSGTLTATAPQIDSSSVIFRPQISAEGVESNTVSPSFEVKQQEDESEDQRDGRQQPDPASLNLNITGTNSPVTAGQDVVVDYRVTNTGGQAANTVSLMELNGNGIGNVNEISVQPGQSVTNTHSWSTAGPPNQDNNPNNPTLTVRTTNPDSSDSVNVNVQRQQTQPAPAALNLQITGTSSPINIGEDLNVQYRVINTGGQSTNATIDATTSSSNGRQARVVETVNPGQSITGSLTIPSTAYGTSGNKTVTIQSQGASAQNTFTVQEAQPDPAELNIDITRITDPVEVNESTNVRYRLSNRGGQTIEANIEASVDGNNNTKSDTQRLEPNDFLTKEMEIPSSFYDSAGTKTLRLSGRNETDTANFEVVEATPDPDDLDLRINTTSGPVNIGEDLRVEYTVTNASGFTTNMNITANVSSANGVQAQATQTVGPGGRVTDELTIPSTAYGTSGSKRLVLETRGASAATSILVREAPDPAQLDLGITGTNSPVNVNEDLDVQYILRNTGGQSTEANVQATVSSANGVRAQSTRTVNPGQSITGELTVGTRAFVQTGNETVTVQAQGASDQTGFTVQQEQPPTDRTRAEDIIANNEEREAASQLIAAYGNDLREYDTNNNGEIEINEAEAALNAKGRGQVSEAAYDAINWFGQNEQQFPRSRQFEQEYLDHVNAIHDLDENGNGEINNFEVVDAVNAIQDDTGEYTVDEAEAAISFNQNGVKFPKDPQAQQQNAFTPPTMDEVADSGF